MPIVPFSKTNQFIELLRRKYPKCRSFLFFFLRIYCQIISFFCDHNSKASSLCHSYIYNCGRHWRNKIEYNCIHRIFFLDVNCLCAGVFYCKILILYHSRYFNYQERVHNSIWMVYASGKENNVWIFQANCAHKHGQYLCATFINFYQQKKFLRPHNCVNHFNLFVCFYFRCFVCLFCCWCFFQWIWYLWCMTSLKKKKTF